MSADVWDLVREQDSRHRPFLDQALADLTAEETADLNRYLAHLAAEGLDAARLADCYLTIVQDTLREQIHFRRHKQYRHSTYAEVAASVYQHPDYMTRYMVGLGLTNYVWPNHVAMRRHVEERMPAGSGGNYLEVGPGHGLSFLQALRAGGHAKLIGVDISKTSLVLTRALLRSYLGSVPDSVTLLERDFLVDEIPGAPFDTIVMGEVLEHLERPLQCMQRIAALAQPRSWIHITTCINSPAIDHIYLFRDDAEVERLFTEAGLVVEDRLLRGHVGTTLEQSRERRLPINVAYVLRKAR